MYQRCNGVDANIMLADEVLTIPMSPRPTFEDTLSHRVVEVNIYMQPFERPTKVHKVQACWKPVTWRNIHILRPYLGGANNITALFGTTQKRCINSRSVIRSPTRPITASMRSPFDPPAYSRIPTNTVPGIIESMAVPTGRHRLKAPRI